MTPLSPAHMALIRPLPQASAQRRAAIAEWFRLGLDWLVDQARSMAARRGLWGEHRDDAVSEVLLRVCRELVAGTFATPHPGKTEQRRLQDLIDNVGRSLVRIRQRELRRLQPLADAMAVPSLDPGVQILFDQPDGAALAARAQAIREIPVSPCARLVLLLGEVPTHVAQADVVAAAEASRQQVRGGQVRHLGLTRGGDEAWSLIQRWVEELVGDTPVGQCPAADDQARSRLAWIIRGPPDGQGWAVGDEEGPRRATDWVDQQLHRARKARDGLAA